MMIDNNVKGFVKDLKFAFQFYIPSYSSHKYNAYEYNNNSMVLAVSNAEVYDIWAVYNKDVIRKNFENGNYESNVEKAYIEHFLKVIPEYNPNTVIKETETAPMTDYQKECVINGKMPKCTLQQILESTTKSKVQVAILDGAFEVYADCLADPVKVYTEQALLDMLKAILILEKTYAGE